MLDPLRQVEYFAHTSRRHTTDKPRIRYFIPMSRQVPKEEIGPLVRVLAWFFDKKPERMKSVDVVSARPAQMMFLPTISSDGLFQTWENSGKLLDPDDLFARFEKLRGDPMDIANLPLFEGEKELRDAALKAERPDEKRGPVGAFCRLYDIEAAMDKFIPGVYDPSDTNSENPRFTYTGGTSSNGAVIYDEGLFLYSNHGTDPVCDMAVNAFDMVRIHRFGDLDAKVKPDTAITAYPSYKAMLDLISEDPEYKKALMQSRYDFADKFSDVSAPGDADDTRDSSSSGDADDTPSDEGTRERERVLMRFTDYGEEPQTGDGSGSPPDDFDTDDQSWLDTLDTTENGFVKPTMPNVARIVQHDQRLKGCVALDEFSNEVRALKSIKTHIPGMPGFKLEDRMRGDMWSDSGDRTVRSILEADAPGYGLVLPDRNILPAIEIAAEANRHHPVKDYLESLTWDGEGRTRHAVQPLLRVRAVRIHGRGRFQDTDRQRHTHLRAGPQVRFRSDHPRPAGFR